MNLTFAYRGRSDVVPTGAGQTLQLAPNLTRDPVAFDAPLLRPVAFREAISALHDAVVSDLRFKKRDKTAYRQWKARRGATHRRPAAGRRRRRHRGGAGRPRSGGVRRHLRRPAKRVRRRPAHVLGRPPFYAHYLRRARPAAVAATAAVRPGHHRRRRRAAVRVLLGRRVDLRLPDRRPLRVRTVHDPGAARHHQCRLLVGPVPPLPDDADVPPDAVPDRPGRVHRRHRRVGVTARRRSTCRPAGSAGFCSSSRR